MTYGTGADEGRSYPNQLAHRIGVPIVNKGVPGDTTADALRRLDRDVLALNPKIVLVCLGGNDLLRQLDPDRSFQSLGQIITRTQDRGALVILLGISGTPLNPGLGARYKVLARRTGCPFVPNCLGGILGNPHLMSDQIHPNAAGYARMADKVEPVLRKYLGR